VNAIELLKSDHREVKQIFRRFEEAGERAHQTKKKLADQAIGELEVHTKIEEQIFYPAVQAKAKGELEDTVREGWEEHHVVDGIMAELKGLPPEDEQFEAKFKVLTENVEHHIEEEEKELLPKAKKLLGSEEIDRLGTQMEQLKQQLKRSIATSA
jgi:hemerythrin-like domain-containing protein